MDEDDVDVGDFTSQLGMDSMHLDSEARAGSMEAGAHGPFEYEDDNDVKQLIRAWTRERGTKDIMMWEGELLENVLHKVEQQGKMLDLLKSDPKTTDEEHFKLQLVATEVERVKYLIRSYLRCRLDKVGGRRIHKHVNSHADW